MKNEVEKNQKEKQEVRSGMYSKTIKETTKIPISKKAEGIYTISFYVKNNKPIEVGVYEKETLISENIETIEKNEEYKRYFLTFYMEKACYLKIEPKEKGKIYIDDIQIEEGEIANYYNYIRNSNFKEKLKYWESTNRGEIIKEKGNKLLKIIGQKEPQSLKQRIPVKGKKKDTYYLSFWYKSESSIPIQTISLEFQYKKKRKENKIKYSLHTKANEWQEFKKNITAKEEYEGIILEIETKETNKNLYVTNFLLIKEEDIESKKITLKTILNNLPKEKLELEQEKDMVILKTNKGVITIKYDKNNRIEEIETEDRNYIFLYNKFEQIVKIASEKETYYIEYKKEKTHIRKESNNQKESYMIMKNAWEEFIINELLLKTPTKVKS